MIDEKAMDLGRTIGQSTEFKALRRAESALRDDTEAQANMEAIQALREELGERPEEAAVEVYRKAVGELQMSLQVIPAAQAYSVALENFEKLMARVNEKIGEGMEKGATSSIITI